MLLARFAYDDVLETLNDAIMTACIALDAHPPTRQQVALRMSLLMVQEIIYNDPETIAVFIESLNAACLPPMDGTLLTANPTWTGN